MVNKADHRTILTLAAAGMITGALANALLGMTKELRHYAGNDFDQCLDALEAYAIRSIENTPIDGVAEIDQLLLVQQARGYIIGLFGTARGGGAR